MKQFEPFRKAVVIATKFGFKEGDPEEGVLDSRPGTHQASRRRIVEAFTNRP